jgi:hypothetical protein
MFTVELRLSAASSIVPTPLPLSVTPGPAVTESRCAPATTTLSARPPGVSARTFLVVRISAIVDVNTCATTLLWAEKSSPPTAKLVPTAGMVTPGEPSVPLIGPFSPPPRLKITAADAPAAWAFSAFTRNVHVPRCISAIRPATKAVKSLASQPLVLVALGVAFVSTAWTFLVTSPAPGSFLGAASAGRDQPAASSRRPRA